METAASCCAVRMALRDGRGKRSGGWGGARHGNASSDGGTARRWLKRRWRAAEGRQQAAAMGSGVKRARGARGIGEKEIGGYGDGFIGLGATGGWGEAGRGERSGTPATWVSGAVWLRFSRESGGGEWWRRWRGVRPHGWTRAGEREGAGIGADVGGTGRPWRFEWGGRRLGSKLT